jgi:hypothetical protein
MEGFPIARITHLMWTISIDFLGNVAVPTKDLVANWKIISNKPAVK